MQAPLPPSKHIKLADVGDDGSVPTIDHPECSTSVNGDENDVAPLEEIISTVDLDCLSSQSSNVDADNEDVGGDCELSPSVDVSRNDIYLESASISKLEYARFDASLYDDPEISRPLYPGLNLTLLQALVKYMSWFTEHPYNIIGKEAMSDMLKFQHDFVLPSNNVLTPFPRRHSCWSPFWSRLVFDCCRNDCIVFGGRYLD